MVTASVAVGALLRTRSHSLGVRLIGNSRELLNDNDLHDAASLGEVASGADLLVRSQAERRLSGSGRRLDVSDVSDLGVGVLLEDSAWGRSRRRCDGGSSRVGQGGDDDGGRLVAGWGALDDVFGAGGELHATGQAGDGTEEVIGCEEGGEETLLDLARLGGEVVLDGEEGAVLDAAGGVGAGVDGGLEEVLFPAHDEVAVVSVAGGVTVGEDELAVDAGELGRVPDGLVEEAGETGGEALGAGAVHDAAGVGDVVHLVLGGHVLAVPARGEHELGADAVLAVGVEVGLVGHEVAVQGALGRLVVVEAVEAERLLGEALLGGGVGLAGREVALVGVAGDHLHAVGEGGDLGLAGGVVEEVVRQHAADLLDQLVLSGGGVLEVHGGSPVGGLVLGDGARGAVAGDELIGAGGGAEAWEGVSCVVVKDIQIGYCLFVHHEDVMWTGTANDKIDLENQRQDRNKTEINIPSEPKMVCAWDDSTPGFTRGSRRARPERARHSIRQKASAEPARTAAAVAAVNFILMED